MLKYGYYNWLRTWLLGFDARAIDAQLDDAHHREPWIAFMREVLADLRPALTDDGIAVLVIGDVEMDRGKPSTAGHGLAERVWEEAAFPAGYRLAGLVRDEIAANRKMTACGARRRDGRRRPIASSCSAPRRPAVAARSPRPMSRSTGPGHRRGCARCNVRPRFGGLDGTGPRRPPRYDQPECR